LDTDFNDLVGSAVARGRIDPVMEGRAWRSFVHVEDLCRGFAAILGAPDELVGRQTFNLAGNDQRLRMIELADLAGELIPGVQRVRGSSGQGSDGIDPENCCVSGDKFCRTFPKFSFHWSLEQGMRQMRDALSAVGLSPGAWRGDRYRRLLRLEGMLERGELDRSLRRANALQGMS
jgi:nucleoside-diphosphate-sugar epimerase